MAIKRQSLRLDHPIVITFLIFAVIGFMSVASEVLKPLSLAVLLSFALAPLATAFERLKLPRSVSVILTMLIALGTLGGIGYKVGEQLTELTVNIDKYRDNLQHKFDTFHPSEHGSLKKILHAGEEIAKFQSGADLSKIITQPQEGETTIPVRVVSGPNVSGWLQSIVGPYVGMLGVGAFVLILVLFLLANREDLRDRIVRLMGIRRVSLTTKSLDEIGQRISRYLTMFAVVNSTIGIVVALGLWAIGIPLAVLWGVLAALFRFIPYVGPATAFILPMLFSIANFPGWREPMMVIALFGVIEVLANSVFEPVIYGKTTGVTALGLLVAAMFWTWLWGALGLLLSTPLTVCLAVLGKYVPELRFFATLLGEEPALEPDVRFYQRLLATDPEGATQIVEAALAQQPREEVFDQILIPTLAMAERDYRREAIDDQEQSFIYRVIGDFLEELEESTEVDVKAITQATEGSEGSAEILPDAPVQVVGVAASGEGDALVLKMLELLLACSGCPLMIVTEVETPLKLAEKISKLEPKLVLFSQVASVGSKHTRYLVWRLRSRLSDMKIVVGRWGARGDNPALIKQLTGRGASGVVFGVAEAREVILGHLEPRTDDLGATVNSKTPAAASTH